MYALHSESDSLITLKHFFCFNQDGNPTNMRKEKDSGEGIEGNWDYHPVYPIWPSAPPPPPPKQNELE